MRAHDQAAIPKTPVPPRRPLFVRGVRLSGRPRPSLPRRIPPVVRCTRGGGTRWCNIGLVLAPSSSFLRAGVYACERLKQALRSPTWAVPAESAPLEKTLSADPSPNAPAISSLGSLLSGAGPVEGLVRLRPPGGNTSRSPFLASRAIEAMLAHAGSASFSRACRDWARAQHVSTQRR